MNYNQDLTLTDEQKQSGGSSIPLAIVELKKAIKERDLLIEALENVLWQVNNYMPMISIDNAKQVNLYSSYHKAKELLTTLKK